MYEHTIQLLFHYLLQHIQDIMIIQMINNIFDIIPNSTFSITRFYLH